MKVGKRGAGMGVVGGALFTLGAIMGIWGFSFGNKMLLYAGIGLCILGAIAYLFIRV
jgi:hypothetical protein